MLLLVLPFAATQVLLTILPAHDENVANVIWTLGLSTLLGLVTWKLRSATPAGAVTGAVITASLMFSTAPEANEPLRTALLPILAVAVLASVSTRIGRQRKERMEIAEERNGRSASQIAANLGIAALVSCAPVQMALLNLGLVPGFASASVASLIVFVPGLAALAEAAADTVSSEIGKAIGGRPRMITTLRSVEPGQNGAVSIAGTVAGIVAAAIVAAAGAWAFHGDRNLFWMSLSGGVFGLLFDSLLGATLESWGWLNNDAVNFLSTASAATFALALLAFLPHAWVG